MPEDQNFEGDIWNKEAGQLLKSFHWSQIGDYDMDILDDTDTPRGVDSLYNYAIFSRFETGVVLEAKSYKTTTFFNNKKLLEKWIEVLYNKVDGLTGSKNLRELFPNVNNTLFKNGLIVVWFKDIDNYDPQLFYELYEKVRIYKSPRGITTPNRIFVLENSNILRLVSMSSHIRQLCENGNHFVFHYPSDYQSDSVIQNKTISIEYLFSKFVLGELRDSSNRLLKKVVFYFGNLKLKNFYRLKSALSKLQFIERDAELLLYVYQQDPEFRKIVPEIKKEFIHVLNDQDKFDLSDMDRFSNLPSWLTKVKY